MMTMESILIYAKVLLWVRGEPSPIYEMKYGPTNQVRARCLCHGSRLIIGWPSVFLGAFCVSLSFCSKKQGCSCDSRFLQAFFVMIDNLQNFSRSLNVHRGQSWGTVHFQVGAYFNSAAIPLHLYMYVEVVINWLIHISYSDTIFIQRTSFAE